MHTLVDLSGDYEQINMFIKGGSIIPTSNN